MRSVVSPAPVNLTTPQTLTLFAISVAAWVAFAAFYSRTYPVEVASLGFTRTWWVWFTAGALVLVPLFLGLLRLLRIARGAAVPAAVALSAPALVCDVFTGMNPHWWMSDPGAAADRHYLSLIVGGVGLLQLFALSWRSRADS